MADTSKMEFLIFSLIIVLLLSQLLVGVKIYQLLKYLISKKMIRFGSVPASQLKKPKCKTCKYRLSYININHDAKEDFFYRCKLHNVEIHLEDGCKSFQPDLENKDSK